MTQPGVVHQVVAAHYTVNGFRVVVMVIVGIRTMALSAIVVLGLERTAGHTIRVELSWYLALRLIVAGLEQIRMPVKMGTQTVVLEAARCCRRRLPLQPARRVARPTRRFPPLFLVHQTLVFPAPVPAYKQLLTGMI